MSAKDIILSRIRAARGRVDGADPMEHIRAHPRNPGPRIGGDLPALFRTRAKKLASDVVEVASLQGVPAIVAIYLAERGLPFRVVCWPGLAALDWQGSGLNVEVRGAVAEDMVGITGAFCGIAETGTLMLLSGPETPAAVSLLPETHVAVLPRSRVVPAMEDAWALLRSERGQLPRAVNFVSGPSRTADIEQTVTLGAHGPYRVLIVLAGEA